jgi:hypothetical protein
MVSMTQPTAMNITGAVLDSAANLLQGGMDSMPVEDEIEWKGLDEEEAAALEAILDEVSWADLYAAAEAAARRLSARSGPVEDES